MNNFVEYVTIDGDRWDQIAWKHYGDPAAYEPILAANPDVPFYTVLPGGLKLRVPVIEKPAAGIEGLPPWKR